MASSQLRLPVAIVVGTVAVLAAAGIAATLPSTAAAVTDRPGDVAGLLALALTLQLLTLQLPGRGSIGFASLGFVLAAIFLGVGPAMAIGALAGVLRWIRTRGLAHRALFDAGNLALAAGSAAAAFELAAPHATEFAAATIAGVVYVAVNHLLLCVAMGVSESRSPLAVWRERFHWARYYLLACGPLAGLVTLGHQHVSTRLVVSLALSCVLVLLMRRTLRDGIATTRGRAT